MYKKNLLGYRALENSHKKRVFFLEFEKFVVDPYPYIQNLQTFLNTTTTWKTKLIMKRENCPRRMDSNIREKRKEEIYNNISSKYKSIFDKLIYDYEQRPWEEWMK